MKQVPHLDSPSPSSGPEAQLMCSGEAEGVGGGAESAHRRDGAVERGIGEGEEEEKEEEDSQQVGGKDGELVGVCQGAADRWEAHVVAEGVAEHRADQVTWNSVGDGGQGGALLPWRPERERLLTCSDEDEGRVGPEQGCVGELKD